MLASCRNIWGRLRMTTKNFTLALLPLRFENFVVTFKDFPANTVECIQSEVMNQPT